MGKMKIFMGIILFFAFSILSKGQVEKPKLYNPEANAKEDVENAIKSANKNNKHVFLQIGGNWCGWCIEFHRFCKEDEEITKLINDNFEIVKVNYSPENLNKELMEDLEFPNRFGFPVFVILDENGKRIHTQNTSYLEDGKSSYVKSKIIRFFQAWTPAAIDPETYKRD